MFCPGNRRIEAIIYVGNYAKKTKKKNCRTARSRISMKITQKVRQLSLLQHIEVVLPTQFSKKKQSRNHALFRSGRAKCVSVNYLSRVSRWMMGWGVQRKPSATELPAGRSLSSDSAIATDEARYASHHPHSLGSHRL